jgi:hypothetical protein
MTTMSAHRSVADSAELWDAARAIAASLRQCGMSPGDRVLVRTSDDHLLAAILAAGLLGDLTIAVDRTGPSTGQPTGTTSHQDLAQQAEATGARIVLCSPSELPAAPDQAELTRPAPCIAAVTPAGVTGAELLSPRPRRHPATPDVALLLRTAGPAEPGAWIALGQDHVLAALGAHLPALDGQHSVPDSLFLALSQALADEATASPMHVGVLGMLAPGGHLVRQLDAVFASTASGDNPELSVFAGRVLSLPPMSDPALVPSPRARLNA